MQAPELTKVSVDDGLHHTSMTDRGDQGNAPELIENQETARAIKAGKYFTEAA